MGFFVLKVALSALLIAIVSSVARRAPALGALIASLPLISVLGMIWLWLETRDPVRMEAHVGATFWYVIPSLPMFLLIPLLLRNGVQFYLALGLGCIVTVALYSTVAWLGPRLGLGV